MAVLFGLLAVSRIPIQLAPDVRKPVVVITTDWPGAAPSEVEREILNPQEEALRGLEGLEIMTSRARTGEAEVTLEFGVGTDMSQSLLLVSNRLDRVGDYPDEAGEPALDTSGSDDSPIAWILLTAQEGNTRSMPTYGDFVEDIIQDRIERVEGVSAVNVFGGVTRELQVVVDPRRLARFDLTVPEVVRILRNENIFAFGRRRRRRQAPLRGARRGQPQHSRRDRGSRSSIRHWLRAAPVGCGSVMLQR